MKKLLLSAAVALIAFTANAQESTSSSNDVMFGAKAGVNFAKLTGDDVEDADGRTGLNLGFVAELPISEKFSLQGEVVYSQQGLQEDFEGGEYKLKLDYINVPVLAKIYVTDGLAFEVGPQFGFNVASTAEFQVEGEDGDELSSVERDLEDAVEGFDFGAAFGASYKLDSGLFFQARYALGLTSVYESSDEGLFQDDLNNSVLSFSVGFMF